MVTTIIGTIIPLCFIIFLIFAWIMIGIHGRKVKKLNENKTKVNNIIIKHDVDISKLKKDVEYLENYVYNDYIEDLKEVQNKHKGLATPKQVELLQRVANEIEGKEVEHE